MGVRAESREAKLKGYRAAQLGLGVKAFVEQCRDDIGLEARYASFDYCYPCFQSLRSNEGQVTIANDGHSHDGHLKDSCFQVGLHWTGCGMDRGRRLLLPVSVRALDDTVRFIAGAPDALWDLDVTRCQRLHDQHAGLLFSQARNLRTALLGGKDGAPRTSYALVIRVLLRVFGCVPALDANFLESFGSFSLNEEFVAEVGRFYEKRPDVVDRVQIDVISSDEWQPTGWTYSRAKVIGTIFFREGANRALARKAKKRAK